MKIRIVVALSIALLCSGGVLAQAEKQVIAIRGDVGAINKAARTYKKKIKMVEGVSLEGTEASYFTSRAGELKKITAKMYGETFNGSAELYYKGGELIFCYIKINKYDTQIGMTPPPKVVRVEEERYYFGNGELIRVLAGKKEIKPGDERYGELKDGTLELTKTLKEAF